MSRWLLVLLVGMIWSMTEGDVLASGHRAIHGPKCCKHRQCCCCQCSKQPDAGGRSSEAPEARNLPMMLPIIETAPVFASPVVYSTQRAFIGSQTQGRAIVVRSEPECVSSERFEELERKVDDLATSLDDLREVVLQQAKILNEISKRLPDPTQ